MNDKPTFALPPVSRRDREAIEALRRHREANPSPLSPCIDQTREEIEAHYRAAVPGTVAVVRNTQGGLLQYTVTEVEDANPAKGRVYVRVSGAFYMKSGANCFHPKGQTTLVVPTPEVIAWARANPRGTFGHAWSRSHLR